MLTNQKLVRMENHTLQQPQAFVRSDFWGDVFLSSGERRYNVAEGTQMEALEKLLNPLSPNHL